VTNGIAIKDLVVLVADKNMEFAIKGLLKRHSALGVKAVDFDLYAHPEKDPGCLLRAEAFLRPFNLSHKFALVIFDREGCGRESDTREQLETRVEERLKGSGWNGRSACIVIDPELEMWVWGDSPHVPVALGWKNQETALRDWLRARELWAADDPKPHRPKEAVESVLRFVRKPRSSAMYGELAENVSTDRCTDGAFGKLKGVLQAWFS